MDFLVADHGSICILTPLSPDAETWVEEHIPDDAQTWGPKGIVVEPRYLPDILQGIDEAGLSCAH